MIFDGDTKLKLDIFGQCFEEWLPVFNNDFYTKEIFVFDFFAGNGKDDEGNLGSPLILLDKAKGKDRRYCSNVKKEIRFFFNDNDTKKSKELLGNVERYIKECKQRHNCPQCEYQYTVKNYDFQKIFSNPKITRILNDNNLGKFILLDQYGFKEINEDIFRQLISFPKTDFIFFISSSYVSRFREHPNTKRHLETHKINFDVNQPKEIHREIAKYYKNLIPESKEYYLHHFSIQKEINKGSYYGLIFGTNHTLGMEKFLKICWKHDKFSGEANFNIENDFEEGTLFYDPTSSAKKKRVAEQIKQHILSGYITNNKAGLKFAMLDGCMPELFTQVVRDLESEGKVQRTGKVNNSSTNIHKVKKYYIQRL